MTEVCRKAVIRGHVQGVGFRYSTVRQARYISGIHGWAKNCRDGSVEVFMCGDETRINRLVEWLHHGPDSAVVNSVEMMDMCAVDVKDFHIG